MNHRKVDQQIVGVCAVFIVAAIILLAIFGGRSDAATPAAPTRMSCFPVMLWDAKPSNRPCHAVTRVFEDGSAHLRLGTASRTLGWCVIPNITEQPKGQGFTLRCWRLAVSK